MIVMSGGPMAADELVCPNNGLIVVSDEADLATRVCRTTDRAVSLFAQCGFRLSRPIRIETRDEIDTECFGVFHCGEDSIEILAPEAMEVLRAPDSLFAPISTESYFDSVLVHELAHALYDGTPCPFETCRVTSEYLAYSYQMMSFSEEDRALLERGLDMDQPISRDYINGILAIMSPDTFATRVWRHFRQNEAPCTLLEGILSGAVLFDYAYP